MRRGFYLSSGTWSKPKLRLHQFRYIRLGFPLRLSTDDTRLLGKLISIGKVAVWLRWTLYDWVAHDVISFPRSFGNFHDNGPVLISLLIMIYFNFILRLNLNSSWFAFNVDINKSGVTISWTVAHALLHCDYLLGFVLPCKFDLGHCRHVVRRTPEEGRGGRGSRGRSS